MIFGHITGIAPCQEAFSPAGGVEPLNVFKGTGTETSSPPTWE